MSTYRGVILYGPPASGKTSITDALTALDPTFQLYKRLKVGGGRSEGYRLTTSSALDRMRQAGNILYENDRYGATYAIDRDALVASMQSASIVVHLGQPAGVEALTIGLPGQFAVIALHCPRHEARLRLLARGDLDQTERLAAWDQTPPLPSAMASIDTVRHSPPASAKIVQGLLRH